MQCTIDFPEEGLETDLNPELRRNLYLVMKESVHNAVKYSQGDRLRVAFDMADGRYHLEIEDSGTGIPEAGPASGNGLKNMRDRIESMGGTMQIETARGKGTRITFKGPLR